MTSEDFVKFYKKTESDYLVVPIKDAIGFNVIRKYQNSIYFGENKRIFINVFLWGNNFLRGRVEMVERDSRDQNSYIILTEPKDIKKVTNFSFNEKEEEIVFNKKDGTVIIRKSDVISLNTLVDILVDNHLTDKLFWKRKINYIFDCILKFLFWLADKKYEKIQIMLDIYYPKDNKYEDKNKTEEPFFKYFPIKRNFLFAFLIFVFLISVLASSFDIFEDFSLSNPSVVFFFFLLLFIAEKVSSFLDKKIKHFLNKEINFISKLHNYLFFHKFKLKFGKKFLKC